MREIWTIIDDWDWLEWQGWGKIAYRNYCWFVYEEIRLIIQAILVIVFIDFSLVSMFIYLTNLMLMDFVDFLIRIPYISSIACRPSIAIGYSSKNRAWPLKNSSTTSKMLSIPSIFSHSTDNRSYCTISLQTHRYEVHDCLKFSLTN